MAKKKSSKEEKVASEPKENGKSIENEEVANEGKVAETSTAQAEAGKDAGSATNEELESLKKELEAAKNRAAEASDQYVRLLAEFDNFRKRSRKEMGTMVEYASEGVLKALLPVIDNFERSLTAMDKTDNLSSVKEGIRLVNENLHRVLEKEGLNPIESVNQPFDSELHEAIHSLPVEEEEKKGTVLEEVEKGYRLKDKVIRYAKVIVGE